MINANVYPADIPRDVIYPIGNGFLYMLNTTFKVVHIDFFRMSIQRPFMSCIFIVANQLFLFCVDGDDGLSLFLKLTNFFIDILELGIAFRFLPSLRVLRLDCNEKCRVWSRRATVRSETS